MDYIIQTRQLSKVYKGKEAVSNVNLHVKKGEIYGFLGPNGAGKTTVMKMLMDLVKPTAGEILLFGEEVHSTPHEKLKRIGSLIEYPVFYDHLTARENLELHCEYMGYYKNGAVQSALDLVRLSVGEKKPVKEFSLGMKQRLGIARAMITKPELLILDEPINGLDPVGIKEMRDLFHMLSEEYGITLFISSHILAEIEQIADTIGVIRDGRLLQEVSLESIHQGTTEYMEVKVDDVKKAGYVLEHQLALKNYKIIDESRIRVYEAADSQAEISKALIMSDVLVKEISQKSHSLEDYFMDIINGSKTSA
ncbi:ABC transporter ATP-binding protein [Bacillus badius]|uniref:ABC transporter ATP-binding protein n=1 Tax=Bacillus badius TaxID=1455 RepID=UPI001CBE1E8C|nr:ABC transporter ATP-binding protein [Bacillus badius]MED0667485.1 ABC transporter ATP-binding protein [Bacillus badius]UAT32039.1 ABC transporter ATP-binding protein [Bacillus badius]